MKVKHLGRYRVNNNIRWRAAGTRSAVIIISVIARLYRVMIIIVMMSFVRTQNCLLVITLKFVQIIFTFIRTHVHLFK